MRSGVGAAPNFNCKAQSGTIVNNSILTGARANVPLWIGLNDAATEGSFVWTTGEPVVFTNWKSGEPNNFGGNEDYVTVNWEFSRSTGPKGTWNDTPLNGSLGFGGNTNGPYFGIIEIASEPASALLLGIGFMALGLSARRISRGTRQGKIEAS